MQKTTDFNADWKFYRGDMPSASYKGFADDAWQTVTLPHDWSVGEPFDKSNSSGTGYLPGGCGWYRKHFTLPDNIDEKYVYITFAGVYHNSRVWCNSNYLGKRPYGYSTFTYDISEFAVPGENVISVKAEREHLADSRWFTGCGIYRDVTLHVRELHHFDLENGIFVHCDRVSRENAEITVEWHLRGGDADLQFTVMRKNSPRTAAKAKGENGSIILSLPEPELWSDDSPELYTLVGEVIKDGKICDVAEVSFGVRSVEFAPDRGFFVNGISKKLKGVCVHHDAGALGAAVPSCVWEHRLQKLKACGCNAIRTSHNPPDPHLLDLCDKMGFFVIDEAFDEWEGCKNKWWQGHNVYPPQHFGYADDFHAWHEKDLSAMILRDRNHPSVILWSIGNEIDYPNDPYVHASFDLVTGNNDKNKPTAERKYDANKPDAKRLTTIAADLNSIIKKHDETRPTTIALAFPEMSNLIGLADAVDVVGYNYKEKLYETDHAEFPDRVIFGSENGKDAAAWYAVRDNDYICGQFLWLGFDFLGEAHGWPYRASGAGLLTLNAEAKPCYYHRCALWGTQPYAHLTAQAPQGEERDAWAAASNDLITVRCYTNCTEAELFLNRKSCGKKILTDRDRCVAEWQLPFAAGELSVICKNADEQTAAHSLFTPGKAETIDVAFYTPQFSRHDMLQAEITLRDRNGTPAVCTNDTIKISIDKNGSLVGIENGDIADLTPYFASERRAVNGKLLAFIRPTEPTEPTVFTVSTAAGTRKTCSVCAQPR